METQSTNSREEGKGSQQENEADNNIKDVQLCPFYDLNRKKTDLTFFHGST